MKRILSAAVLAVTVVGLGSVAYLPKASANLSSNQVTNGKIVFQSNRSGDQEIWIMDADGSNLHNLTNSASSVDTTPSFSPDGTKVAYESDRAGGGDNEIWTLTLNSDKTGITGTPTNVVLASGSGIPANQTPVWSPDGTKIYYYDNQTGKNDIYYKNSDGSGSATNLTNTAGSNETNPSFSPDGLKLAFDSDRDNPQTTIPVFAGDNEIWTMNADGTGTPVRIVLAAGTGIPAGQTPTWSADGSKIFYYDDQAGDSDIYSIASDGSQTTGNDVTPATGSSDETNPFVSPDGSKVLFSSTRTNGGDIYTMNLDGSTPTVLNANAGADVSPNQQKIVSHVLNCVGSNPVVCTLPAGSTGGNYTIDNNEVLIVDGTSGNIVVNGGGYLYGNGTTGTITNNSGGHVSPGPRPGAGCLTSGNVNFNQGSFLDIEIAGTTPCTQYDQLKVNGTVSLGSSTLNVSHLNGYKPAGGEVFTIISNDGSDAVTGTFNGLAEGATFVVDGVTYKISYKGGDGNDVTLTAIKTGAPGTPDTGLAGNFSSPLVVLAATTASALALLYIARRFA